jgi:hypothetical protein
MEKSVRNVVALFTAMEGEFVGYASMGRSRKGGAEMNEYLLTREEVMSILHNTEVLYEFFLERMMGESAETRMRIVEARNKIHLTLLSASERGEKT